MRLVVIMAWYAAQSAEEAPADDSDCEDGERDRDRSVRPRSGDTLRWEDAREDAA